jgi:hypothetical protein
MLPAVRTDEEWQAVVFDEKIVRPAAEDLAARLGLAGAGLRRYHCTGSSARQTGPASSPASARRPAPWPLQGAEGRDEISPLRVWQA